jgi:hypothetical protein
VSRPRKEASPLSDEKLELKPRSDRLWSACKKRKCAKVSKSEAAEWQQAASAHATTHARRIAETDGRHAARVVHRVMDNEERGRGRDAGIAYHFIFGRRWVHILGRVLVVAAPPSRRRDVLLVAASGPDRLLLQLLLHASPHSKGSLGKALFTHSSNTIENTQRGAMRSWTNLGGRDDELLSCPQVLV